jgi:general secretion pathway protein G
MTNVQRVATDGVRHSGFVIDSSFVVRHSSFRATGAFTLIELIVVIAIIIILAGLVLSTAGYARKKAGLARAETEIAAISAACENYKADNGIYPRNSDTDGVDARTSGDPTTTTYQNASLYLYIQISGIDANRNPITGAKSYFIFKPNQLSPTDGQSVPVEFIRDPFGNSYGYSTANQANPANGYNPTFDLWSTTGTVSNANPPDQSQWIKNW